MAIYKTRNAETGDGMWGMQRTRGIFTRISGNLLKYPGECYQLNNPRNIQEDTEIV